MVLAFSFCLYGPENPLYYVGMIKNIDLISLHFPDWKIYIHVAPDVEASMIETLRQRPNVILRETGVTGAINMIHRFYTIDEPDVDIMFVRDADSRIHVKDRWAIREFLRYPQFIAHTIRDHKSHKTEIMGGLWALRKSAGINIHEKYASYKDPGWGARNGHDQCFLTDVIYPLVFPRLLIHYSCGCLLSNETGVKFPFLWTNDLYCGRIETPTTKFVDTPLIPSRGIQTPVGFLQIPLREPSIPSVHVPPPVESTSRKEIVAPSILKLLNRK